MSDEIRKETIAAYTLADARLEAVEQAMFLAIRQVYNVPVIVGDTALAKLTEDLRSVRRQTGALREAAQRERLKLQSGDA
jgi:hypothetical protein